MAKTLGDYISCGRHEFVAFVRNMVSLADSARSNYGTLGNDLGNIHLGVLVCDRELESHRNENNDIVKFFHKEPSIYDGDSNIMFWEFNYAANVVNEVPLALEVHSSRNHNHLKKRSKEFREAKKLLKKYGLY